MQLSLISPEKTVFSGTVDMAVIPGSEGDFGILDNHAPFMTTLRPGQVNLYNNGILQQAFQVTGGFAEVTQDRCVVLADAVEEKNTSAGINRKAEYSGTL